MQAGIRNDDLSEPQHCVCFGLRRAARAVTRLYDEALKPCGLRATQFSLLAFLAPSGKAQFSELKQRLTMDQTTLTRNLRPLERRGLIAVRPGGTDRRTREIVLSAAGRALHARALPLWRGAQREVTTALGAQQWRRIQSSLNRLISEVET